jgi:hypothetical protein
LASFSRSPHIRQELQNYKIFNNFQKNKLQKIIQKLFAKNKIQNGPLIPDDGIFL